MPQTNSFISANINTDDISRLANDIVSNQRLDDDIYTHDYENIKHFDFEHHAVNRHDRRAINNGSLKFEITAKRLYAASQRVL